MTTFTQTTSYRYGLAAESAIARWLMRQHGYSVLPVYEKVVAEGKGPQLFTPGGEYIAPDLFAFKQQDGRPVVMWIEAKHKTAFTWHRITGRWVTGIDLKHYEHYCMVDDLMPWPVWLLFLHEGGQAKDSPADSPSGLFGRRLNELRQCENHRHSNYGRSGMVYWAVESLHKMAMLEELLDTVAETKR